MSNIWFSSDQHYFHKNIAKFCPRTRLGETVEEMNELLIAAHNKCVQPEDTVYYLGDFSFGNSKDTNSVLSRLNGVKHLIYGNHDKVMRGDLALQRHFETVQDYKRISIGKQSVVLFHFPMREWDSMHYGAYHLFGHVHGGLDNVPYGMSMDVGIDTRPACDMTPWSWEEIDAVLSKREVIKHHAKDQG